MNKATLEPLAVVSLLAAGVWFNRNKRYAETYDDASDVGFEDRRENPARNVCGFSVPSRSTVQYRHTLPSRVLAYFPYLREVALWLAIYLIYQAGRGVLAVYLHDNDAVVQLATRHGVAILELERTLGFQWENAIQTWFIERHPLALDVLNRVYSWVHITATIAFLGWLYYTERTETYTKVRRTLGQANLLAFCGFTFYACAPPRLLPKEYGFVDTVHTSSVRSVWNQNRFQNQYAAVPSLHFGYSLLVGICLFLYGKAFHGRLNVLGLLYPALILVTIVATANHYILDAVLGALCCGLAYLTNGFLSNFKILEDYLLYVLHVHRPDTTDREGYKEVLTRRSASFDFDKA